MDVVSFRYTHPQNKEEQVYIKFMRVANKLEINAMSSLRNDDIHHTEIE